MSLAVVTLLKTSSEAKIVLTDDQWGLVKTKLLRLDAIETGKAEVTKCYLKSNQIVIEITRATIKDLIFVENTINVDNCYVSGGEAKFVISKKQTSSFSFKSFMYGFGSGVGTLGIILIVILL